MSAGKLENSVFFCFFFLKKNKIPVLFWGHLAGTAPAGGHSAVAKRFQLCRVGAAGLCAPAHRGASVRAPESHCSVLHPGGEFQANRLKGRVTYWEPAGGAHWATVSDP